MEANACEPLTERDDDGGGGADKMAGVNGTLLLAVAAAVLGMLQFGYNTGVFNSPQALITDFIRLSYDTDQSTADLLYAVAVSLFAVGGMVGCPVASWVAEKRGRKGALVLNVAVGVAGALLMALCRTADSFEMLAIGRLLIGFNCGFATTVAPTYVSEIAPVHLRGAFGTVNQLAVTVGMVGGQILGIDQILGTADGWQWLLGLSLVPLALQLVLLPLAPESPRHLVGSRDEEATRSALRRLRGDKDVEDELRELHAEDRAAREAGEFTVLSLLRSPELRKPLMIGVVMHLSQQLGGINAVLYYSTSIFQQAGLTAAAASLATTGVGGVLVVMALVTIPLMDRLGRRTLQLAGLGGMTLFAVLMTVALNTYRSNDTMTVFAVIFTLLYVACFGAGPGSIPWMIMSELFGQGPRSAAVSTGALVNWLANFVVGLSFPSLLALLGDFVFVPFAVLLVLFFAFTYFKLPETKNKTVEEITTLFK